MPRFNYGCETICNENDIYPAMVVLVEQEGMSERSASQYIHEDSGGLVTAERARSAYRKRKGGSIAPQPKPKRKQTKPETKTALNETVAAIKAGEVSQTDVEEVTYAVANKISHGELPYELGAPIARAFDRQNPHKPKRRKKKGVTLKSIHSRLNGAANDLLGYLDSGLKPQGPDKTHYEGIRHQAPMLLMCFHQMGVDIEKVMATVRGRPQEASSDPKIQPENIITVE